MHLYLDGFLGEDIQQTAYAVNIYLKPHRKARDLLRHSLDEVERGNGPRIVCPFLGKSKRASGKQRKHVEQLSSEDEDAPIRAKSARKRKTRNTSPHFLHCDDADDEDYTEQIRDVDAIVEDDEEDGWGSTLRPQNHTAKRTRRNGKSTSETQTSSHRTSTRHDVIELSSD